MDKRLHRRCFSVIYDNFFKYNTEFETTCIFSSEPVLQKEDLYAKRTHFFPDCAIYVNY